MPQARNHFGDLETGQLAAFTGLCALCDLDFNFLARAKIFGGYAETATGDLFDDAVGVVAIFIGLEPLAVFATFAGYSLCANPVHGNRECLMRLRRQCAKRHARRDKAFANFGDRFDFINRNGFLREVEFQQIAQVNRRQFPHALGKLCVGRIAVIRDRALQKVHQTRRIGMLFAAIALLVKAANGQACYGGVKRLFMAIPCVYIERMIAFARNLVRHSGEEVVDQGTRQANRFEIIAATIAGDDRDAHFGHDLQQPFIDGGAIILDRLGQGKSTQQPARMAVANCCFGQICVYRGCANANEYREIMRVETFGGADVDRRIAAQTIAHQMRVHSGSGEDHGNTNAVGADIFVGQEQFGFAHAHGGDGFFADPRDGRAKTFLSFGNVIGAVNFCARCAKGRL